MRATHAIWGPGEIRSTPIYSKMLEEYVVLFKPDAEEFTVPVPRKELA